jgi:hypothetical protein
MTGRVFLQQLRMGLRLNQYDNHVQDELRKGQARALPDYISYL